MDFRIRQLQCFLTLSDLLNYGKTARALYMSQPTITFQIKSLEETFGVKLFERDRQKVVLTEAGVAFRQHAQSIMDTVQEARESLSYWHERLGLRISCGPVGQFVLLPDVIRRLAADYPEFDLEVSELTTEQQIIRLAEGRLDALFMVNHLPVPGLRFDPVSRQTLVAMVSRQSRFADAESLSVEQLRHTGVIAARAKDSRFEQGYLRDLLAPFGIQPLFVEARQSCSVQLAYAAAGEGLALVPKSVADRTFPGLVAVPFQEPLPEVQLGLVSMVSRQTPSLEIFRKIVKECADAAFGANTEGNLRKQYRAQPPTLLLRDQLEAG